MGRHSKAVFNERIIVEAKRHLKSQKKKPTNINYVERNWFFVAVVLLNTEFGFTMNNRFHE